MIISASKYNWLIKMMNKLKNYAHIEPLWKKNNTCSSFYISLMSLKTLCAFTSLPYFGNSFAGIYSFKDF